jgi:hypothetical protein
VKLPSLSRRERRPAADDSPLVQGLYRSLLRREADPSGLVTYQRMLDSGASPEAVAHAITEGVEYERFLRADAKPRRRRPERYHLHVDVPSASACWVFDARDASDFDWLESLILDDGYYELPGVWTLGIDEDKQILGDLISNFRPDRALELGCATGAVMRVLADHGIVAEGLEISRSSYERAFPEIRDRIHLGDLLTTTLPGDYDFIYGLDLFEHLNPNRLSQYLERLSSYARPGGWLYAIIPANGHDEVFGEVFPLYLPEWPADVAANRHFSALHCDDDGYPMHGHLIWAHTHWWVEQFERAGFVRQREVERAVHDRYAHHLHDVAPARGSFYLFTAGEPRLDAAASVLDALHAAQ